MRLFKRAIIAAVGLSAVTAYGATPGSAEELRLAHFMSTSNPFHAVFEKLGADIAAATDGEVTIRVFPGGELGANPIEQFNRAIDGVADISFSLPGFNASLFPRMILAEFPGIVDNPAEMTPRLNEAFERGLFGDEFQRVKLLGLWNITPGVLFTRDKPVRSLADLEGMKIRVASQSSGALIAAWGGVPVFTTAPEIYSSLQTGVVDGTFIDSTAAVVFRLSELAKFMTVGMESFLNSFYLVMNRESFDGLSATAQDELNKLAGTPLGMQAFNAWTGLDRAGIKAMTDAGAEIITLSPEDAAEFNAITDRVREQAIADAEADGVNAREFVEFLASGN